MICTRVYVSGYHNGASRGNISNLFYYYNVDSIIMKKGFCFVDFDSNFEAERAMRNMNGQWMDGRKIKVEMARYPPNLEFSEKIKTEGELDVKLESSSSYLLRCEACCNRFNYTDYRPRSLPCGHTVCSHCIKVKFKSNSTCPFCRTFCGDWKAPSDYPNNYFVLKLLDYESKIISDTKKPLDPDIEKYKQLELSKAKNHIYSCNDYLIDLKSYKNEQESKLKALQEDISNVDKRINEGETILKKLKTIQGDIKSIEEEVDLTLVTSVAKLFYQEFKKWSKDALNKINNNDSFTSQMEDTSQFRLQSDDVGMLDFLAPTVDSDDEREIVTVGSSEEASDTILSSTGTTLMDDDKEHQSDSNSNSSYLFESCNSSELETESISIMTTASTTSTAPYIWGSSKSSGPENLSTSGITITSITSPAPYIWGSSKSSGPEKFSTSGTITGSTTLTAPYIFGSSKSSGMKTESISGITTESTTSAPYIFGSSKSSGPENLSTSRTTTVSTPSTAPSIFKSSISNDPENSSNSGTATAYTTSTAPYIWGSSKSSDPENLSTSEITTASTTSTAPYIWGSSKSSGPEDLSTSGITSASTTSTAPYIWGSSKSSGPENLSTSGTSTASTTSTTPYIFGSSKSSGMKTESISGITTASTISTVPYIFGSSKSSGLETFSTSGTTKVTKTSPALRSSEGREVFVIGTDIHLGWIYNTTSMNFSPPKTPREYRHEEYKSFKLLIESISDMKKFQKLLYKNQTWFRDYQDSSAQEIIKVNMTKISEKRAIENVDHSIYQKVATSLFYKVSVELLLFYDAPVPDSFKSDLRIVLNSIMNEEEIAFPISISNGIRGLNLYDMVKVKISNNIVCGFKEACKHLKDKKRTFPRSALVSHGKMSSSEWES